MAHYAVYTYITELVSHIDFRVGIEMALLLFGIGSFVSVMLAMRYTDTALRQFTGLMFLLGAIALAAIYLFPKVTAIIYIAFCVWGISCGPLVTMLQAAVAKHSASAKAIATSVRSSMFNFSNLLATSVGGFLLTKSGIMAVVLLSGALLVPATLISYSAKSTLG